MGALALLGVLGVLGLSIALPLLFEDDPDDDPDETVADDAPEDLPIVEITDENPAPVGEVLTFDGFEPVTGTDGDDTLIADVPDFGPMVVPIDLLGGDDIVVLTGGENFEIRGGAGDDSIVLDGLGRSNSVYHEVFGDDGNDTLVAGEGNNLYGGAGDDNITINRSMGLFDSFSQSDAGTGDDDITITSFIGDAWPVSSAMAVNGGEGNDTFTVELTVIEDQYTYRPAASISSSSGVVIDGFDPEEDSLVIEIDRAEGQEDRTLASAELAPLFTEGNYYLQLVFSATDDDLEMRTGVTFRYVDGPLSTDDIDIVDLMSVA